MASVFRVLKPSVTFKEIAALMKELDTGEGFSNENKSLLMVIGSLVVITLIYPNIPVY